MRLELPTPLIILFSLYAPWQMGVVFFSGTALSLGGRVPIPVNADYCGVVIVLGYIVSAVVIGAFQERLVWLLRSVMLFSLAATAVMFLPLPESALSLAFYAEAFCCVFMICGYMTLVITLFTPRTELKRICFAMLFLGFIAFFIHSDSIAVPFYVFNSVSCVCELAIIFFLFKLPAERRIMYLKKEDKVKPPHRQIFGFIYMTSASGMVICFANNVSESVKNGTSVFYASLMLGVPILIIAFVKLHLNIAKLFRLLMLTGTLGFILALASEPIPVLVYASCAVLGATCVAGELFTYYGIFLFSRFPSRLLTPAAALSAIPAVIVPMLLLEVFRENVTLLYAVYAVISIVFVLGYSAFEQYFSFEMDSRAQLLEVPGAAAAEPSEAAESSPGTAAEAASANVFSVLTGQENVLVSLILQGYTQSAVCDMMNISINTQKSYRKSVYMKLGIHSKRELFELAEKN